MEMQLSEQCVHLFHSQFCDAGLQTLYCWRRRLFPVCFSHDLLCQGAGFYGKICGRNGGRLLFCPEFRTRMVRSQSERPIPGLRHHDETLSYRRTARRRRHTRKLPVRDCLQSYVLPACQQRNDFLEDSQIKTRGRSQCHLV